VGAGQNILSVDIEDYFHVEAFTSVVELRDWDRYPCRVENNTKRLLDMLDQAGVKTTCFILGWVAEHYPELVRQIAGRGHELACHSYWHRMVYTITPEVFREDTRRAKDCIEQAAGTAVYGYRAPSFSITAKSLWALDILAEEGFQYDSSIFPIKHDLYGMVDAPRKPFRVNTPAGPIVEFPMSTFRLPGGPNMPVAGGGYLRILPFWYTRLGVRRALSEGLPIITYFHPWELDPEQPRIQASRRAALRHYTNLDKTEPRLRKLMAMVPFRSFRDSELQSTAEPSDLLERHNYERQHAASGAVLEPDRR
jgi:polysaccharide deacetylase family protein (PEP-CTERM system associated)